MTRYRVHVRKPSDKAWRPARPKRYPGGIYPSFEVAKVSARNLRKQGYKTRLVKVPDPFVVYGRGDWKAKPARSVTRDNWLNGVRVVVHHTAGAAPDNIKAPLARLRVLERAKMREIQRMHMAKGWSDGGYNYAIMPSGRVYTLRGFGVRGAHVENANTDTCGIVFVGIYTKKRPTKQAVAAYWKLRDELKRQGAKITRTLRHSDLNATACPALAGDAVGLA